MDTHLLGRIGAALVGAIAGGLVGLVTTFTHRQLPPWGLIAGLLVIAALLAGLRLAVAGRLVATVAALAVLAAVGVLALPVGSGSVLVADDELGWTWLVATAVLCVGAVAWPSPRARPERPGTDA
ncbi:hypothetical protein [Protaetiibacter intestinalis]|uniref:Histidinol dehydrogenase n=1 Tax=Protaetiibacter intestinalis TaxID=2419774 RepID=A0A387B817_9MICO|nr:hypothetical protein [Protaetiibacter intestinalis]AYF98497.1 hypothetical protein D7I47_09660 [Protaetiibacter intestinalis]